MNIVWFSWKDIGHPKAGGAEIVSDAILTRLVTDGHKATLITARYPESEREELLNGYRVMRVGGTFSVYFAAYKEYRRLFQRAPDCIVEEINTIPFFTAWYTSQRRVLFFHQLAREIWFYQMPLPISLIGYLAEPIYLYLLSKERVVTVSHSSKVDLVRYGFRAENITIISQGIDIEPVASLKDIEKFALPTIVSLGSVRAMKRTMDVVKAFEILKNKLPNLKLVIAGDTEGNYGKKVCAHIAKSAHQASIRVLGKVSKEEKLALLSGAHAVAVTSIKEGWGLVVTEANSQGTPAVAYNVDGLRDSVQDGKTGLLTRAETPESLADSLGQLLSTPHLYASMRERAWTWSTTMTFEKQYQDFLAAIH